MGKFNRGDGFDKKKRFDQGRDFGKGGRPERPTMHQAVCSDCGRDCEVPFRPTGDKPVYCRDCFQKIDSAGKGRSERRDSGHESFGSKPMFKAVCDKCHKDCEVPFRPTGDKPVYCRDCFRQSPKSQDNKSGSSDQSKKQFETINSKLDYILKLLSPKNSAEKPEIQKNLSTGSSQAQKSKGAKIKEKNAKKSNVLKKAVAPKKATKKTSAKKKK